SASSSSKRSSARSRSPRRNAMPPLTETAFTRSASSASAARASASSSQRAPSAKWPRTSQKTRSPPASRSACSGASSSDHASAARMLSCSACSRSSRAVVSPPPAISADAVSASSTSHSAWRRRSASSGAEQVRLAREPLEDLSGAEQLRPGSCQLDRERQPVEPGADACDVAGAVLVELESRVDGARPRDEEPQRVRLHERFEPQLRVGQRERGDRVFVLGRETQRCATRRQYEQPRRRGEQVSDHRSAVQQLLEVVEHEQQPQRS